MKPFKKSLAMARDFLLCSDLRFLVRGRETAPTAEFLEVELPLNGFLIFMRIIIPPFAGRALQSD